MSNVQPFKIEVPQPTLDDLQLRLANTRWPDEIEGADWEYGTNLGYLKELVAYWQSSYDWHKQEAYLNQFAHFKANLDDLNIHFIHERGKGPKPLPLILTHGWPDSFLRYLKLIGPLTDPASFGGDPEDAFDLIVPSLPGFGFSDRPRQSGMNATRMAALWARLMTEELGYERYSAGGGDIGGGVTNQLAVYYPQHLVGIHLSRIPLNYRTRKPSDLSAQEQSFLERIDPWLRAEGAYAALQATKPQTLSYGLNDSPVGLAGWIVEKFRSWSDCDGEVERRFSKDELLTNIMLYWVTNTISSANRYYYEAAHDPTPFGQSQRIEVPTGVAIFPKDIVPAPREWGERWFKIEQWSEMPRGGHFGPMEEPALQIEDFRSFFRPLRQA
jgi:microsomal epoxide hydrolase